MRVWFAVVVVMVVVVADAVAPRHLYAHIVRVMRDICPSVGIVDVAVAVAPRHLYARTVNVLRETFMYLWDVVVVFVAAAERHRVQILLLFWERHLILRGICYCC